MTIARTHTHTYVEEFANFISRMRVQYADEEICAGGRGAYVKQSSLFFFKCGYKNVVVFVASKTIRNLFSVISRQSQNYSSHKMHILHTHCTKLEQLTKPYV